MLVSAELDNVAKYVLKGHLTVKNETLRNSSLLLSPIYGPYSLEIHPTKDCAKRVQTRRHRDDHGGWVENRAFEGQWGHIDLRQAS